MPSLPMYGPAHLACMCNMWLDTGPRIKSTCHAAMIEGWSIGYSLEKIRRIAHN